MQDVDDLFNFDRIQACKQSDEAIAAADIIQIGYDGKTLNHHERTVVVAEFIDSKSNLRYVTGCDFMLFCMNRT